MHIGGMRTALFNWLFARHHGGAFVLRIDDTDRQRNLDEALGPILRAFRWLGLDWDEGPEVGGPHAPYFQSQRNDLYRAACDRLLRDRLAYRDFETPEQTKSDREAAEREKRNYVSARRSLDLSDAEIADRVARGEPHVIRLLVPRGRTIAVEDAIRGHVEWDTSLMPDPVVLRGDGTPLYNFATVVDDAALEITHVIRAEEHLTNTAVQLLIFEALGHALPTFAHIPYVAAPGSKEKLSKRKLEQYRRNPQFKGMFEAADRLFPRLGLSGAQGLDPVMVEYYERIGYLPAGVLNGLARLGWSLDDKTEFFSRAELVEKFTLDRVVKAPAGFDPDKLLSYQAHWMGQLPVAEKVRGCLPFLAQAKRVASADDPETVAYVTRVIETLGDRVKLFAEILDSDEFFAPDDQLPYDEKTFDKRLANDFEAVSLLRSFRPVLADAEPFEAGALEQSLKEFCEEQKIKIGQIIHALRVATTGKGVGAGMFETLAVLGRERTLRRIDASLARLATQ
jgi:glutamyl-tRNA synthetase